MRFLHPNVPFAPRGFPFFYGWAVMLAGTFGVIASIPGQTIGVSVFTNALIEATGRSRLSLSNAYLLGTVIAALGLPRAGTLFDRFGARATALFSVFALALTLLLLADVGELSSSPAAFGTAALVVLFACLRLSGQGMLMMVSWTMVGKWFDRRRGLASAISGLMVSAGFAVVPLALRARVEATGFRGAWHETALFLAVGGGTLIWLFYRDNPEECGLAADRVHGATVAEAVASTEAAVTRAEALRSLPFWAVTAALAFQNLIATGVSFHIVDLAARDGLGEAEAVGLYVPLAVASTVSAVVVGVLADRVRVRSLLYVLAAAQAAGLAGLFDLDRLYLLAVLGIGAAGGFLGPLSTVALPRFFGRMHLGSIAGASMMAMVLASAAGPTLFAFSERVSGGYDWALAACFMLPATAAGLAWAMNEEGVAAARAAA